MGFKLGKVCPYIQEADLVIGETTCDGKKKAYEVLGELHNVYVMELPQMKREKDLAMWRSEIVELMEKVVEMTGKPVTAETLRASIKEVNDKRRALQRIAAARAADPSPISGKDALLATQVAFYDDVPRFTQMMNALADELEQRVANGVGVAPKGAKRVLITGTPMALPNWKLHDIIEKSGAVVVGEEMCTGSRYYQDLVSEDSATLDEMIDDIADKYLDINCACFTPNDGPHRRRHPDGQGPRRRRRHRLHAQLLRHLPDRGSRGGEGGPGGGLPRPAHRDGLLDGGRRPAADPRRGVPGDDLATARAKPGLAVRVLGIDIGSRTVDAVWVEDGRIIEAAVADSGFDPAAVARELVQRGGYDTIVATGYGRHVAREAFGCTVVTEIKAYGLGAHALFPDALSVLDIGGQDTKVIALGAGRQGGRLRDERQVRRRHRQVPRGHGAGARLRLDELAAASLAAERGVAISSMCTVFAESEVTGLVHRGEDRGAHRSRAARVDRQADTLLARARGCQAARVRGGRGEQRRDGRTRARGFAGEVLVPDGDAQIDPSCSARRRRRRSWGSASSPPRQGKWLQTGRD